MAKFEFDDMILWPSLLGATPCTKAYAAKMAERDAIKAKPEYVGLESRDGFLSIDELSPADYDAYCRFDNELGCMQAEGQLGHGERFPG